MSDGGNHGIVIVRRKRGGEDGGHHGGVWKIAYADFMTAMMAFFLVMWLVNAADDKAIVQVAAYFNPLRLTEKLPSKKGLRDGSALAPAAATSSAGPPSKDQDEASDTVKKETKKDKKKAAHEHELFVDPNETLKNLQGGARKPAGSASPADASSASTSQELQDPFERQAVQRRSPEKGVVDVERPATRAEASREPRSIPAQHSTDSGSMAAEARDREGAGAQSEAKRADLAGKPMLKELAQSLEAEVRSAVAALQSESPAIDVTATAEGILISLTDDANYGMFASASAEPRADLIDLMERIGAILNMRSGQVYVRGHTDGRPYRSTTYDNWRLSTARAHMAHYMLARGGLQDSRVVRIEGYADRRLRNAAAPEAAQNRRIEILLKPQEP